MTPPSRESRLAALCRLLAAAALLAAVAIFFQLPLRAVAAKAAAGGNPFSGGSPLGGFFGPSKGFFARIDSQPPGATVRIDGKARGETPFFGNVACTQGRKVSLEIEAAGYAPWRRELDCREDGQVEIDARLSR